MRRACSEQEGIAVIAAIAEIVVIVVIVVIAAGCTRAACKAAL
ncbi:MAG: hypothetical protein WDN30_08055 [Pararobbsia sp.]